MQRACIAFSIYRPRKRSSNQRAGRTRTATTNLGEPAHRWRSRPQRHRHCAEAHLHPRRQYRRRSTRCARTSRRLCAASRDLPLVLGHFRRFASSRRTRLLLFGRACITGRFPAAADRHARRRTSPLARELNKHHATRGWIAGSSSQRSKQPAGREGLPPRTRTACVEATAVGFHRIFRNHLRNHRSVPATR